jgi:hypothetical protein
MCPEAPISMPHSGDLTPDGYEDSGMERISIGSSRLKWAVMLVGGLGFVAAGVLILIGDPRSLIGWTSVTFFGAASVLFTWQLFDARPRVVIDSRGVLDRTLWVGLIEWEDIRDVHLKRMLGNAFLCLELRDPAKYTSRLSPVVRRMVALNRRLGFTDLSVNLVGLKADPVQVEELVRKELIVRRPTDTI